jgi:excisionase family DNA binding protein
VNETGIAFLYSPRDAATFLGVGRTTIYKLLNSGELESMYVGAARRIPLSTMREFINRRLDQCSSNL